VSYLKTGSKNNNGRQTQKKNGKQPKTSASAAPMGDLAPGSAYARPSDQPPIDTSVNFQPHVSAESAPQICHTAGGPQLFLLLKS
jgi:hypothetical protein